jgi:hypothetical protein
LLVKKLTAKKERLAPISRFQTKTIIEQFWEASDVVRKTSTKFARQKDGTDLSNHYHEIGIRAVASATHNARHRGRSSTAAESKHETKYRTEEDTDE